MTHSPWCASGEVVCGGGEPTSCGGCTYYLSGDGSILDAAGLLVDAGEPDAAR